MSCNCGDEHCRQCCNAGAYFERMERNREIIRQHQEGLKKINHEFMKKSIPLDQIILPQEINK